ncbi:anti-sigma factor family protein [Roseateles koreensis]|uniref:anti-sigma factor family protein n=1 Tax=Roseateles koreensis TaxID=2987526 RepID=UPI0030B88F4E
MPSIELVWRHGAGGCRRKILKVMRNCREITALVLQAEDRKLGPAERVSVRLHMMICQACPRFLRQLQLMRRASTQWRNYSAEQHED